MHTRHWRIDVHLTNKVTVIVFSALLCGCSVNKTYTGGTSVSSKPYYCRGSWYYPQNYYEYDEVGIASWYGNDCAGKQKATGLIFNPNDFTAAHRTLPIPTVIKVTNLRNNRSIVVVVDDRGPYTYAGRILDLSYAAAKTLDLHRYKPSKVRVQSLPEDSLKLSNYIRTYCKNRRDPYGRSWTEIYYQEIKKSMPRKKYSVVAPLNHSVTKQATTKRILLKKRLQHAQLCRKCRKAIVYTN